MNFFCIILFFVCSTIGFCNEKTSSSDDGLYPLFCLKAAQQDHVFTNFKRDPIYTAILEHVNYAQGLQYLEKTLEQTPNFISYFKKFQENDLYGNPHTYFYENFGVFSPTTLRYIKTASDLKIIFENLNDLDIIEIGGGYGGLCKIIGDLYTYKSYTIVDLPEVLPLIEKYTRILKIKNVKLKTLEEINADEKYDLVISNYAFTECIKPVQETYLNKILRVAQRGFITCNHVPGANVWSKEELAQKLHGIGLNFHELCEEPLTFEGNYCIYWK